MLWYGQWWAMGHGTLPPPPLATPLLRNILRLCLTITCRSPWCVGDSLVSLQWSDLFKYQIHDFEEIYVLENEKIVDHDKKMLPWITDCVEVEDDKYVLNLGILMIFTYPSSCMSVILCFDYINQIIFYIVSIYLFLLLYIIVIIYAISIYILYTYTYVHFNILFFYIPDTGDTCILSCIYLCFALWW